MRRLPIAIGTALALTSVWAVAQDSPESLLPPGFEEPARPARAPPPSPAPAAQPQRPSPQAERAPGVSQPSEQPQASPQGPAATVVLPRRLPTLAELEAMTPDDLDELLGLKPKFDIPPAARRSMEQIGIVDASEGGFAAKSLAAQSPSLVRAALAGNNGPIVSRWGHILLRRALASRLDAPAGMDPADFAALRAALLLRMGEHDVARALVQDIDAGNFTPALTSAAVDTYIATADITGACPVVQLHGGARDDPQWQVLRGICAAFAGDEAQGLLQLDRHMNRGTMSRIDILLAQKYAGAAGKARRAVTIEWEGVDAMTPWRYALAIATGLEPPVELMRGASPRYDFTAATAPMLGLPARAAAADRAAGAGVLSSAAMVDLYSQIYTDEDIEGEWATRAASLQDAYVAGSPGARLAAMRRLWDEGDSPLSRYARLVLTAYAAARLPASAEFEGDAARVIASMLAAGLDRNAMRWANHADIGTEAWALLALADEQRPAPVAQSSLETFRGDDMSEQTRKSQFLLAGLAGLGRVTPSVMRDFGATVGARLDRQTRWTRTIDQAAEVGNPALVALLAGVGMQGSGWDKMTPLHLYHIVRGLERVGLGAEARMIAAEAVARG